MPKLHATVEKVTERVIKRSESSRSAYIAQIEAARSQQTTRTRLSCTNIAHAVAAVPANDKLVLHAERAPNLGIVTSYNDMLSAHQPFETFPERIKSAVRSMGATAQVAGGTPAMCDGVTQGQPGMELSLFSRDVIAMSTAIALSHDMFDAGVYLGVCDKIVPGLLMGALTFGHLPAVFIPAGPMTTGASNKEKAEIRQRFATGDATRQELLESESRSYHGPGTCTFYGTANSNQMLMEFMGLHLPGAAFINPGTPLRDALTEAAAVRALSITDRGNEYTPVGKVISEKSMINGLVGLLATSGSTNHTIHLVAIAKMAGIIIDWDDFDELSHVVPLLTHVYPSGSADVNEFHAAGGLGLVIRELLGAGLLHDDVTTVAGDGGLSQYTQEPWLDDNTLSWREGPKAPLDETIVTTMDKPFQADGGLRLMHGNLGRAVIKTSALADDARVIEAPAVVFHSQAALTKAFEAGELERDLIAVVKCQGPRANGMPELHKMTPPLGVLMDRGFKVALVTDGRMSGASGKVPAAIHVSPECVLGGPLGKVQTGDIIRLDTLTGEMNALVNEAVWNERDADLPDLSANQADTGRELFKTARQTVTSAESGAISLLG
jgi:phosphogluconate dehydratase